MQQQLLALRPPEASIQHPAFRPEAEAADTRIARFKSDHRPAKPAGGESR